MHYLTRLSAGRTRQNQLGQSRDEHLEPADVPAWAPPAPPLADTRWSRMQAALRAELDDPTILDRFAGGAR